MKTELEELVDEYIEQDASIENERYSAFINKTPDKYNHMPEWRKQIELLGKILELSGRDPLDMIADRREGELICAGLVVGTCTHCGGKLTVKDKDWIECKGCKDGTYPLSGRAAGEEL